MNNKTKYIFIVESLAQSIVADTITFGMMATCIWFSVWSGSSFWTVVSGAMFFLGVIFKAHVRTEKFTNIDDLVEYAKRERKEPIRRSADRNDTNQ